MKKINGDTAVRRLALEALRVASSALEEKRRILIVDDDRDSARRPEDSGVWVMSIRKT